MVLSLSIALALATPALGAPQPPAQDVSDLLPGREPAVREAAFAAASASEDEAYVAPLLDLLAFARTAEEWYRILDAIGAIHGEDARGVARPWRTYSLRRADDPKRSVPDGYAAFKAELFAGQIDPAFRRFLAPDRSTSITLDEVVWGGVGVDGIPALDDADAVAATDATFLTDDAPVFGVALGGEARAYPTQILDWHEMANDVVGGVPVSLSWCTLCGAPVLYRAELDGERITFGSSGLLWRSNKLMYDRGTDTLWNQITGRPVIGPLTEREVELEVLPIRTTTWGAWRRAHPKTTVVSPTTGVERDYSPGAAYGEYFASSRTMFPAPSLGATFRPKERIVVVRSRGDAAAVSLEDLERTGTAIVTVAERRVVVLLPPSGPTRFDARWRAAIEGVGGDVDRPTVADLEAAVRASESPLPELDDDAVATLPRTTRRALLESRVEGLELDPALRDRVAVRDLVGDVRAFEAPSKDGGSTFARTDDPDVLMDDAGRLWRVGEDALVAEGGERRARVPSHLAFGFAWDAHLARRDR